MATLYPKLPDVEDDGNGSDPEVTSKKAYEPSDDSDSDAEPSQRLLGFGQQEPAEEASKGPVDKSMEALSGLLSKFGQEYRKESGKEGKRGRSDQQPGYESEPEADSSKAATSSSGNGLFAKGGRFATNPLEKVSGIFGGQQTSSRDAGATKEQAQEKNPAAKFRNEDEPMADANATQPQQKETDAADEGPSEHKKATKYTKEQREAVTRIRNCSKKDYYGILGLEESCSANDIKEAYHKLAQQTHPDKNKYDDAPKAFKLISRAYQILRNPQERKAYEKDRKQYKLKGELDPLELWGEEFAENASGTDSDSSDRGDDSEDEEEAKPDEYRRSIYREATPWVQALLENADDVKSISEIEGLNKKITKRNNKEGLKEKDFHIKSGFLVAIAQGANSLKDGYELEKLANQLVIWIYNNSYPAEWINISDDQLKKKREEIHEKKRQEAEKKKEEEKKKSKRKDKGKERKDDDAASGKKTSFSAGTEIRKPKPKWKPGETRKGEKILGYRPFEKTNYITDETSVSGYQFVIEKKGQPNPIALASGEEVGRRAVRAYIALPEKKKNDIRYSEEKYGPQHADDFDTMLGFASNPFKTWTKGSNRDKPNGYALWEFKDSSTDLVSRTCMRGVLGKTDADNEITEFYEDIGETPPENIRPRVILHKEKKQKWLTSGREIKKSRKSRRDADSDEETDSNSDSDSDSESRRRSVRRKKKEKKLASGRETKRRRKSRRDADSDEETDSDSDSDSNSDSESRRRSVKGKKKTRQHAKRRARDDESSDEDRSSNDSSSNRRRASRKSKDKGKSKPKADQSTSHNSVLEDIMQKFMKEMAEQNKIQTDNMVKQFEKAMRQVPVAGAA